MSRIEEMLVTHPKHSRDLGNSILAETLDTLNRCAQICRACADACLAEEDVASLTICIRTDLDCADVCSTTAAILTRQTDTNWNIVRSQLKTCIQACQICAAECQQHAYHHEHCRICAEACAECEQACQQLLGELPA